MIEVRGAGGQWRELRFVERVAGGGRCLLNQGRGQEGSG